MAVLEVTGNETLYASVKILHVPFTYFPDPCGGTEVYVASLCAFLSDLGLENVVAAPADRASTSVHQNIRVRRFETHPSLTQDMMYGSGDPIAAAAFARILDEERPDLVHFHAFSAAVSALCLREARHRGIPAICTYHTPTNSCVRGTLLRWGGEVCDGVMEKLKCSACFLQSHGIPQPLAKLVSVSSLATKPLASIPGLPNSARILLRSSALVEMRHSTTREWWNGMNRVIALCDWTQELLTLNGVPAKQIRLVRHGLPSPSASAEPKQRKEPSTPFKMAFLGRLDPTKGVDLLINALKLAPDLQVSLDIFGIAAPDDTAAQAILTQARCDERISIKAPIPSSQVKSKLRDYDCLLVPSRWLETGPLVVLEAFAAGTPVIGSNLGGIAERVRHEVDGLLVPECSPGAWRDAIVRVVTEPDLISRLRAGVTAPRSMSDVAAEMRAIYLECEPSSRYSNC